jgi:ATP-binding cassette subfamily F protein 3
VASGPPASRNGKSAAKLEQQIEDAEAALRTVEDELAEPGAWSDPARSAESSARHEAAKQAVDALYAKYEALEGANR